MDESEKILLDATLQSVVKQGVFRAVLPNGHGFVALFPDGKSQFPLENRAGSRVKVEFSPFDFSKGRIVDFKVNKFES